MYEINAETITLLIGIVLAPALAELAGWLKSRKDEHK